MTGDSFLTMLDELIFSEIRSISGNEGIIFLLDGTSLQYTTQVRNFLNNNFPGNWIGRGAYDGGLFEWPAYSPDLNISDTSVLGQNNPRDAKHCTK